MREEAFSTIVSIKYIQHLITSYYLAGALHCRLSLLFLASQIRFHIIFEIHYLALHISYCDLYLYAKEVNGGFFKKKKLKRCVFVKGVGGIYLSYLVLECECPFYFC